MPPIKKPFKIETIEIDSQNKSPIIGLKNTYQIIESPAVKLLHLYLEKIELMEPEERRDVLSLIKKLFVPKYKLEHGKLPIEEEYLEKETKKASQLLEEA